MRGLREVEPRVRRKVPSPSGGSAITPEVARRIAAMGGIIVVLLGVLLVRLWFLQVVGGQQYEQQAAANSFRTILVPAPRGDIIDRNGRIIAGNRPSLDVVALPQDVAYRRGRPVLARLARVLQVPPRSLRAIVRGGLSAPSRTVTLAEDISPDVRQFLSERQRSFPGIELQTSYRRYYPHGTLLANALGYMSGIQPTQLAAFRRKGYSDDEKVGAAGLEERYEGFLRGVPGERRVEVDVHGNPVPGGEESSTPAHQGNTLQLTIDIRVQKSLEEALRTQVEGKGTGSGAAGVVLDPRNGQVLAMASYPAFDPNAFVGGRRTRSKVASYLTSDRGYTFDRAIQGRYPPGSTFKAVTAAAALSSGVIGQDTTIYSPGVIELYHRPFSGFKKEDFGDISVEPAIARSSDTFFYQVGDRLYRKGDANQRRTGRGLLWDWARRFGLGDRTGIDLPGEDKGRIPDLGWKGNYAALNHIKDAGAKVWLPGDSINMSIGQGDLLVTPIQLATAYAAIANGGSLYEPVLAQRLTDPRGRLAARLIGSQPQPRHVPVSQSVLDIVKTGLTAVTNDPNGTAAAVFGGLPPQDRIAGKTGTAESGGQNLNDHSWFVGYGPYDQPKALTAIVIEHAGQGANAAAPAVCQTMAAALSFDAHLCGSGEAKAN